MEYTNANKLPKLNNKLLILETIRRNYPISRNNLSRITTLSLPSVSRIVSQLIDEDYLEEIEKEKAMVSVGRKAKLITLKKNSVISAGVDYNGSTLKIGIINEKGEILKYKKYNVSHLEKDPQIVCEFIYEKIKEIYIDIGKNIDKLFGIGISMPGIIENYKGIVTFSAQLGWNNVNIKEIMEKISGINCVIDNDIKSAAYAEYNDNNLKSKPKTMVLIHIGSGLGTAVVMNGNIFRGVTNSAGELGHVTQDVNGTLCNCGKEGCLQTNVANSFLEAEAGRFTKINSVTDIVSEKFKEERWSERIINKYITYTALTIDTAAGAYNPDAIVLHGDLIDVKPELFQEICDLYFKDYQTQYLKNTFSISKSKNNGLGSIIGIGLLASQKFFQAV